MEIVTLTESERAALGGKGRLAAVSPAEFRSIVRRGEWTRPSVEVCYSYAKFNLAVVPADMAFEFLLFCLRNPRSCDAQYVTEPGEIEPKLIAPGADLRTDLPRYRVFKNGGLIDEPTDVIKYWRDDLVSFLIGYSPNFDYALDQANVQYRMIGAFDTNIPLVPAGRFHGNMAVTCSIFKASHDAIRAIQISSGHRDGHGPPVHIGDPALIGIKDLAHPDISTLIDVKNLQHPEMLSRGFELEPGEIPMFWGAGVTPQLVAMAAKVPFMITHSPAHLFISDKRCDELAIL